VTDDAASGFEVPPPAPELKRLEPLIGKWHTRAHTEDSVLARSWSRATIIIMHSWPP
jgi:hypothetical protein